ncbi:unnamed protein product [Leptidea sinapis]|uniref:Uncharacterized protein n=1 Tax=Leptidea sinapis TaxID=189913 RepID=A0A5E4PNQ5_9NEOP|nr:unnamed protein product [Leptidea sinapis]VVD06031.1 unnamed protein product [Leptidea sinapis]
MVIKNAVSGKGRDNSICQDQSLDNLADIAVDNTRSTDVAAVSTSAGPTNVYQEPLVELVSQLSKLSMEVAALRSEVQRRGRSESRGRQGYD